MSAQKEKVLVVVLAETRAHELTFESFKASLLDGYSADLALCVAKNSREDASNPFYSNAKYVWSYPEPEDWGDAFDDAQRTLGATGNWRRLLEIRNQWLGGIKGAHQHPGSAGILLYFRWFLKQRLISEGVLDNYDRFIITRSDFVHTVPSPPLELLAGDKIWIPYGEFYGGYTDRHIVAGRSHIVPVLSIADPILARPDELYSKMHGGKDWNLERYIKFAFRDQGLEASVDFLPYTMYSVRALSGHTRWQAGTFHEDLGYFVKYQGEYSRARLARRVIGSSGEWTPFKMWALLRLVDAKEGVGTLRRRLRRAVKRSTT